MHAEEEIKSKIKSGELHLTADEWEHVSGNAKECVKSLLNCDEAQRATAAQVLKDPWVKSMGAAPTTPLQNVIVHRKRKVGCCQAPKRLYTSETSCQVSYNSFAHCPGH